MAKVTTAEIAEEFGTTGRELRKFLRTDFANRGIPAPGKGARYSIEKRDLRAMGKRFAEWKIARETEKEIPAEESIDSAESNSDN